MPSSHRPSRAPSEVKVTRFLDLSHEGASRSVPGESADGSSVRVPPLTRHTSVRLSSEVEQLIVRSGVEK